MVAGNKFPISAGDMTVNDKSQRLSTWFILVTFLFFLVRKVLRVKTGAIESRNADVENGHVGSVHRDEVTSERPSRTSQLSGIPESRQRESPSPRNQWPHTANQRAPLEFLVTSQLEEVYLTLHTISISVHNILGSAPSQFIRSSAPIFPSRRINYVEFIFHPAWV